MTALAAVQLVVADAGPLIALAVAGVLPLVLKQFELCVPQAVLDECLSDPYAPGAALIRELSSCAGFSTVSDNAINKLDSAYVMGLGSGEVAVLSYAHQHRRVALVDERRARRIAHQLGVSIVGSGAVLLALKKIRRRYQHSPRAGSLADAWIFSISCPAKAIAGSSGRVNLITSGSCAYNLSPQSQSR